MGRSLCYDIEKPIPVDSWIEARDIAHNIPVPAPFNGLRRVSLQPSDGGGFRALITLIDIEKIRATFDSVPRVLIPFSWLIPAIANGEPAEVEFAGERLLCAPAASGFITSSGINDEHCRDFWWSIDVEPDEITSTTRIMFSLNYLRRCGPWSGFIGWRRSAAHRGAIIQV